MASDISVLILARNEEANIRECIESCTFAGEVIVIDDFSTDDTEKIAEACGARVIRRAMDGDWGGQQTFAVEQARCGWIFLHRCRRTLYARSGRRNRQNGGKKAKKPPIGSDGKTASATTKPYTACCGRITSAA